MNNLFIGFIRTITPVMVGSVASWFISKGIAINPQDVASVTAVLNTLFTSVYYLAARELEQRHAMWGLLLGIPKKPEYKK